ncbi:phage head closure protein [Mammaliicoccus lentus]|uniref:phage head closure protein n=1 Tax=Mammaliicoccus lentus TaxID=42858 RepID=UPI003A598717
MAYHFNTRIKILKRENAGPYPEDYEEVEIAQPWADIKTMKGSEYVVASVTANEEPIRFIIRYRKGIDPSMFVEYNDKKYNIKSVANDDGKNETITIFATTHDR